MDYFRGNLMAQAILLEAQTKEKIAYIDRCGEIHPVPVVEVRKCIQTA